MPRCDSPVAPNWSSAAYCGKLVNDSEWTRGGGAPPLPLDQMKNPTTINFGLDADKAPLSTRSTYSPRSARGRAPVVIRLKRMHVTKEMEMEVLDSQEKGKQMLVIEQFEEKQKEKEMNLFAARVADPRSDLYQEDKPLPSIS